MHGAALDSSYCGYSTLEHLLKAMPNTVEVKHYLHVLVHSCIHI